MAEAAAVEAEEEEENAKIPISLLSGFLGSGKTTLLQETLDNKGGVKVGVIVNDMAAVNIDAKLVRMGGGGEEEEDGKRTGMIGGNVVDTSEVVELQNGCACCSASGELLDGVMKLLAAAAERDEAYDRIVIEMSGVAEPKNVRKTFFEAKYQGHPVFEFCDLQNMVTVIDSGNFVSLYESTDDMTERSDLAEREEKPGAQFSDRKVVDLLTEQVEVADYLVLNKQDLVSTKNDEKLRGIVGLLNPKAELVPCEFGGAPLEVVLGSQRETWVANNDDEDDFRVALNAVKGDQPCTDPDCGDESHGHSHSHAKAHTHEAKGHSHDEECEDAECTDASHSHGGHSHEAKAHSHDGEECNVVGCDDPSHSHGAGHSHEATPEEKWGISSFVYSRRRPFHPQRLREFILKMPVSANADMEGADGREWAIPEGRVKGDASPLDSIIRSKGFVWLSNFHRVALYWSHAGQFFDLKEFGMYWASTPLKYWPSGKVERSQIVEDFGPEGFAYGDRRQELVIIGVGLDQAAIEGLLDECLLTDEEMDFYAEDVKTQMSDRVGIDYTQDPPVAINI